MTTPTHNSLSSSPNKAPSIGIVANLEKSESPVIVRLVHAQITQRNWTPATERTTFSCCESASINIFDSVTELAANVDLLVVIGGDGTMLRVARKVAGLPTPLLGIKTGRLGFLTQITPEQIENAFDKLAKKDFSLEPRTLLSGQGKVGTETVDEIALNDFVISRGIKSRIIELDVHVDDQFVARYLCDGMVIATPTGSTAYSLAAGGGIVTPNAEVFCITPICPHSFQNRAVIVNANASIRVQVLSEKLQTILAVDGQKHFALNTGDNIFLRRSEKKIQLIHFPGTSFFNTLREKLHWIG